MTKEALEIWYDTYIKNSFPLCNYIFIGSKDLYIDCKEASLQLPFEELKHINLFVELSDDINNNSVHFNITCKSGVYFSVNIY